MESLTAERISHARRVVAKYSNEHGFDGDELEEGIKDLITDLWHLANSEKLDMEAILDSARKHYEEETHEQPKNT